MIVLLQQHTQTHYKANNYSIVYNTTHTVPYNNPILHT